MTRKSNVRKVSEDDSKGISRRQFVITSAEAAVLSLFGSVGLDSVVQKVLGRVSEKEAIARIADDIVDGMGETELTEGDAQLLWSCYALHTCSPHNCPAGFTCDSLIGGSFICNPGAGGGTFGCNDNSFTCSGSFTCNSFDCLNPAYTCKKKKFECWNISFDCRANEECQGVFHCIAEDFICPVYGCDQIFVCVPSVATEDYDCGTGTNNQVFDCATFSCGVAGGPDQFDCGPPGRFNPCTNSFGCNSYAAP